MLAYSKISIINGLPICKLHFLRVSVYKLNLIVRNPTLFQIFNDKITLDYNIKICQSLFVYNFDCF